MQQLSVQTAVRYQIAKAKAADAVESFLDDERGELGSWLILAAGLAVAAAAAVALLAPWFNTKVTQITAN
ncbi:MAG: hypothetical protein WBM50_02010 [Acidimicrobiales bacterium]